MRLTPVFITTLLPALTVLAQDPYAGFRVTADHDHVFRDVSAIVVAPPFWSNWCIRDVTQLAFIGVEIGNPMCGASIEAGFSLMCTPDGQSLYTAYWRMYPNNVYFVHLFQIALGDKIRIRAWTEYGDLKVSFENMSRVPRDPYIIPVGLIGPILRCTTTAAWFFKDARWPGSLGLVLIPRVDRIDFTDIRAVDDEYKHYGWDVAQMLEMRDIRGMLWASPYHEVANLVNLFINTHTFYIRVM